MPHIVNGPIPDSFMKDTSKRLSAAVFDGDYDNFRVIDQLLLPHSIEYIDIKGTEDAFKVIKSMQVRGAPLIALVGIRALLLDLHRFDHSLGTESFIDLLETKISFLVSSRPTAINLKNAAQMARKAAEVDGDVRQKFESVCSTILKIFRDEEDENRRIIWNGYQEILSLKPAGHMFTLTTICNTGSLATVSWGTALGVIRAIHEAKRLKMVYALETRPYNQGVRLTATELSHGGVPFKVVTDSMGAWTMKQHTVDAVLVGADQVALNGDTANKIGTYMLAILSKHHDIPFYPVVPFNTINTDRQTGDTIPIEERPADEMLHINGTRVGALGTPVWNPAFDVTPAALITKIITDFGNFHPHELETKVTQITQNV